MIGGFYIWSLIDFSKNVRTISRQELARYAIRALAVSKKCGSISKKCIQENSQKK